MTVRSSVAHDVLSVLLGNFTGNFWIGLHRPLGCADPAAKLKGYEWVTKDRESDFSNWLPSFDSSCSSSRCVSVSPKGDFKWSQESCSEQAAGFLCEHAITDMCKSLAESPGESVMYTTSLDFASSDLLSVPPGTIAVRMPSETKYLCYEETWKPAPWSCETLKGGCEYKCVAHPSNTHFCYCPSGQTINPVNKVTCETQRTGDPCQALKCEHICYQNGDSYLCACEQGFQLAEDGRSCVDFNDCSDARQCPGDNFVCVNKLGGFDCVCKDGYELRGGQCIDRNECASGPCEHECQNTPGSYTCSCYDGYRKDPQSPDKCKLFCGKEECPAECDPNNKFQCYCPDGYISEERGHSTVCMDIDECPDALCDQSCINTFGSYACDCSRGYSLVDEYKCIKSDDDYSEGSGATTVPHVPKPGPTRQPPGVPPGALVAIIIFTVVFIVLVVFLADYILNRRRKTRSSAALKAAEGEGQGLRRVNSES